MVFIEYFIVIMYGGEPVNHRASLNHLEPGGFLRLWSGYGCPFTFIIHNTS